MKSILARIILSLSSGCVNQRLDEPRNTCLSPGRFQLHRYASRALCVSSSFPRATTVDCMLDVMPKNLWRFRDKRCRNASEVEVLPSIGTTGTALSAEILELVSDCTGTASEAKALSSSERMVAAAGEVEAVFAMCLEARSENEVVSMG